VTLLQIIALIITLTALFSYANHRWVKLPTTIGVMVIALVMSLGLIVLDLLDLGILGHTTEILEKLEFDEALMQVMLSFLLFAGALHINLEDLARQKWIIGILASVGVLLSTFLVGTIMHFVFQAIGVPISYTYCLLFGSLIAPTDPIAVLGILKTAGAPKSLETKVAGESLFNDGVAVVVFAVMFEIAVGGEDPSFGHIAVLFAEEALGGAALGLALGWLTYQMLKSVDHYSVEALLTLALVMGGYALAAAIHVSGPIAMVVAGLLIGNHGRSFAMSDRTRQHLDTFWELNDEVLNALLFVLLGLEILVLKLHPDYVVAGLIAFVVVLGARFVSVGLPVQIMRRFREFTPGAVKVMTWGGLRGGISVALALSIPAAEAGDGQAAHARDLILTVTYVVVVLSILLQGLTIGKVIKSAVQPPAEKVA